jgi:hypothetical protein
VLRDFAKDYGLHEFSLLITTIMAAGYAALAAMITRSILGSVVIGFIVSIAETMLLLPLSLIGDLLNTDSVVHIYRFLPWYNRANLFDWAFDNEPAAFEMPSGKMIADTQLFSEVVLVCWVVGLIALTAYLFQRQDITN